MIWKLLVSLGAAALLVVGLVITPPEVVAQQGTTVNPAPGSIWTWLGPTFGAAWAPAPLSIPPNVYDPRVYGAQCNGTADDTSAFRAVVAAFNASNGGSIILPAAKTCIVNVSAGPIIITAGGTIRGHGIPGAGGGYSGSEAAATASSSVVRDISGSANPVFDVVGSRSISFEDFMIEGQPIKTAGYCVKLTGVTGTSGYVRTPNFERMQFNNCNGIDIAYAVDVRVTGSVFMNYAACGIRLHQGAGAAGENPFDFGDWRVTDSLFFEFSVNTGAAFCHEVGSGGTFLSNTVNGGAWGYYMNWSGSHSEETRIIGNIMNQQTKAQIGFFQAAPNNAFSEVIITGNNFSTMAFEAGTAKNPQYGNIYIEKGIPPNFDERWMHLINISNNTFNNCYDNSQGAKAAIHVRDGDNIIIANNQLIMNNNPAVGPCQNNMVTGISFIQTEGFSYNGDANRSGVEVCTVTDNQISFSYQYYTATSAYLPLYGLMAPLCVINDSKYKTQAMDAHLGYGRTIDKVSNFATGAVAGWTTVATIHPSSTAGLTAIGFVNMRMDAHTALTAYGVNDSLWWFRYEAGALTVGLQRPDITQDSIGGGGFPQFKLVASAGDVALQVGSSNGVATVDAGHFRMIVDLPGALVADPGAFYFQLLPATP